ncbi:Replicase polyprotein 1a, partial [Bienertia sinuspersici]
YKGVTTYEGYLANGFRLNTKKRQSKRKTQNSGVMVRGDSESGGKDFYGMIEKVIVLEYDSLADRTSPRVVSFRCNRDTFGSTLFNVNRRLKTNEPFALSSQIKQVFYVMSHKDPQWRVINKTKPRNYFDFPYDEDNLDDESIWENVEFEEANVVEVGENDDESYIPRDDVEPTLVSAKIAQQNDRGIDEADEFIDDESNDKDDHEDVFSDRDSSIASLDKDLEEVEFDSDSSDESY